MDDRKIEARIDELGKEADTLQDRLEAINDEVMRLLQPSYSDSGYVLETKENMVAGHHGLSEVWKAILQIQVNQGIGYKGMDPVPLNQPITRIKPRPRP
jgi:hypothetical protein